MIRGMELVVLFGYLVVPVVVLLALYWVVRLAVRHALGDARRTAAGTGPSGPPTAP